MSEFEIVAKPRGDGWIEARRGDEELEAALASEPSGNLCRECCGHGVTRWGDDQVSTCSSCRGKGES